MNRPINCDVPLSEGMPSQISERLVQESPRNYSGKVPDVAPKKDTAESCISFDRMHRLIKKDTSGG